MGGSAAPPPPGRVCARVPRGGGPRPTPSAPAPPAPGSRRRSASGLLAAVLEPVLRRLLYHDPPQLDGGQRLVQRLPEGAGQPLTGGDHARQGRGVLQLMVIDLIQQLAR